MKKLITNNALCVQLISCPFLCLKNVTNLVHNEDPNYVIRVAKSTNIDTYLDIVGQITVYHKETVLFNRLIAIDTDLNKLNEKISQIILYHQRFGVV